MNELEKKEEAKRLLQNAIDRIDNNTCGMSLDMIIETFGPIMSKRMNAEDVCDHYGISRATLTRWVEAGRLPKPHHIRGANVNDKNNSRIYWFAEELPKVV